MIILTEQKRNELKLQLENNKKFQFLKNDIGLSFEDFDIIDSNLDLEIHQGKKDIGDFCIFLKNGVINSAYYDLI
jgi:hypothetical protein